MIFGLCGVLIIETIRGIVSGTVFDILFYWMDWLYAQISTIFSVPSDEAGEWAFSYQLADSLYLLLREGINFVCGNLVGFTLMPFINMLKPLLIREKGGGGF